MEAIPVAIPAKTLPEMRPAIVFVSAIDKPPVKKSTSLTMTIYLRPNLSTLGPANKAPTAAPKLPIATKVPIAIYSASK